MCVCVFHSVALQTQHTHTHTQYTYTKFAIYAFKQTEVPKTPPRFETPNEMLPEDTLIQQFHKIDEKEKKLDQQTKEKQEQQQREEQRDEQTHDVEFHTYTIYPKYH